MGILDFRFSEDPEKDRTIRRGLLDFGLNMLAQGGKPTSQAIGNSGLLALQNSQQRDGMAQRAELHRAQLDEYKAKAAQNQRQQRMLDLPQQFVRKADSADNRDVGQAGAAPPSFDMAGYSSALMGLDPVRAIELQQMTNKQDPKLQEIDPTKTYGTWQGGKFNPVVQGSAKPKDSSPLGQLIAEMNALAPNDPARRVYQNAISKSTTHGPGVSISYGTGATAMQAPDGSIVMAQLPNKPGAAPQIVVDPATGKPMRPPPQDRDIRPTEAQAKAATYKSQMEFAERELAGIDINQNTMRSQIDTKMAGGLTNPLASKEAQRARQAQEQWSEAFLRFKSGAAATKDEVALNVRTFFPQPGDDAEVVAQKKRARDQAARDLAIAAGQKPSATEEKVRRYNPATGKIE